MLGKIRFFEGHFTPCTAPPIPQVKPEIIPEREPEKEPSSPSSSSTDVTQADADLSRRQWLMPSRTPSESGSDSAVSTKASSTNVTEADADLSRRHGVKPTPLTIPEDRVFSPEATKGLKRVIARAMVTLGFSKRGIHTVMHGFQSSLIDGIDQCIIKGADINARDRFGETILFHHRFGPPEVFKILIKAGADVNARYKDDRTLLHYPHTPIENVKLLIHAGADVNARDRFGETTLFYQKFRPGVVKLLIHAGADINARDRFGETILGFGGRFHHRFGPPEIIKLLIDAGATM